MRHAIEVAWNARAASTPPTSLLRLRTSSPKDDKPTNGEFIALVSDKLSVKKSA